MEVLQCNTLPSRGIEFDAIIGNIAYSSKFDMRKALVLGSSGLIGSYLVKLLAENVHYEKVYAAVRKKGKLQDKPAKVEELVLDFDNLNFVSIDYDDIYCALGTTIKTAGSKEKFYRVDHDYVVESARRGLDGGAHRFMVVSSIGANAQSSNFYLKVKGETERDLGDLGFGTLLIFRPSLLLGPREENRPLEKFGEVMLKIFRPLLLGSLKKQIPVHASQVASCMIDRALNSQESREIIGSNEIRTYPSLK